MGSSLVDVADQVEGPVLVAVSVVVAFALSVMVTVTAVVDPPAEIVMAGVCVVTTASLVGEVITGAAGSFESMVKWTVTLAALEPPRASRATALTVAAPFASSFTGMADQLLPLPVAVSTTGVPELSVTVSFTLATEPVVETVNVGVLVVTKAPAAGAVTTGAAGGWVSTVKLRDALGWLA